MPSLSSVTPATTAAISVTPQALHLTNTLSGQKEVFIPRELGKVGLYVCGPTVYDHAHLGHARCYITWDILYRTLQLLGYQVTYVRNVTDVDDKILARAVKEGVPIETITQTYFTSFSEDMAALNVLPPTHQPHATQYIAQMIEAIEALIKQKAAYATPDGSVYFRAKAKADYGKLSRRPLDEMLSANPADTTKESPMDFALWKGRGDASAEITQWSVPWSKHPGRPGWHIECSAMSRSVLGDQFDIHAGGMDLIFPHHENEIAQSECWTGKTPMATYWLHNGFVNVDGEKMSKSLGNFATIRDALTHVSANTLRVFLLTNHYRMPVDFTPEALAGAKTRMQRIERTLRRGCDALGLLEATLPHVETVDRPDGKISTQPDTPADEAFAQFAACLCDDLNTAQALAVWSEALNALNTVLDTKPDQLPAIRRAFVSALSMARTLGFDTQAVFAKLGAEQLASEALVMLAQTYDVSFDTSPTEYSVMTALLDVRQAAKTEKNWAVSDAIRDKLLALGYQLMDKPGQQTAWETISG